MKRFLQLAMNIIVSKVVFAITHKCIYAEKDYNPNEDKEALQKNMHQ